MTALLMQGIIFFKYASIGTEFAIAGALMSSNHKSTGLDASRHTWGNVFPTLTDNQFFDATSDVQAPLIIHVAQVATANAARKLRQAISMR